MKKTTLRNSVLVALALTSSSASAVTLEELAAKLDQLSTENAASVLLLYEDDRCRRSGLYRLGHS